MKALFVTNHSEFTLKEIEKPGVGQDKVLIKVAYCGICGSDLPRYFQGAVHSFPQILGHEFSGIVEKVGVGVEKIAPGDRVVVAPLVPCDKCLNCQKGLPAMCTNYSFIGSREPGAMAEYVSVPEKNCIKIPDNMSLEEAAVLEPLTVAIHSVERVNIAAGASVMIFGAGTIGLLTLLALRARGVGKIVMTDLNPKKLELAKNLGADVVLNPNEVSLDTFFKDHELPDVIIESSGSSIAQVESVKFAGKKGKVVFVGTCTREVVFPPEIFEMIIRKELEITGSWMSYSAPFPGYEWTTGLSYMSSKVIDVRPLITGVFTLEDKELPFKEMVDKELNHIKLLYKVMKD